ncbi:MAG TPA: ATP-binding protein [Acidimicrobiia bacterium]|jgi:anti-sigma regulatory factor (Ser/Thr protein kinase)
MLTLETQLSPGVDAGRQARAFVHDILHDAALDHVNDVIELLSTELVNNAVVHAAGSPTLRITPGSSRIRVEVDDPSIDAPVLEVPDGRSECGRGLLLVASIADDWGFEVRSRGKTVWFEVSARGDDR